MVHRIWRKSVGLGLIGLVSICGWLPAADDSRVSLTLDPEAVLHPIDRKVYGHFLEHIYHSCNGGLWGELVWNRSFEQVQMGRWSLEDGVLRQASMATDQRWVFGDREWTDYEFTLKARKEGGNEGFLILFRVADAEENAFYWFNLGGWGNARSAVERGLGDGQRWGVVGPNVPLTIETDRWYDLRLRCEGRRIQCWVDGEQVLDFTDDERALLKGQVGVGSWATKVAYRDLRVVDLAGNLLFEGPAADPAPVRDAGKHWEVIGDGVVTVTAGDALNGGNALLLDAREGECGAAQGNYHFDQGAIYKGSLWAKSERASELQLRVRSADPDQAPITLNLEVPAGDWSEIPFQFRPEWTSASATVELTAAAGGRVLVDQVSIMPAEWEKAGGFRPDLLDAIAALNPPVIRWPGGCFASAYRWKAGIGPQRERRMYPIEIWDDQDSNSFGTDEFIEMCRRVGAEPLIVVNIGTDEWNADPDPEEFMQEVLDWMEYCNGPADSEWGRVRAANGHPAPYDVKYWEIDNETWHMGAEAYAAAVKRFAPRMRAAFPDVRLIACGSGGMGASAEAWNGTVIGECAELVDYISIHHYENPDRFNEGPGAYEAFFRKTGEQIAASANPNIKIYVSEWNAQTIDWRTGLYCGGILNAFERCGDILEIGGPALFLRHQSATGWNNAFINFDQSEWFPAPNYVVMKLWQENYLPNRLQFEGATGGLDCVATGDDEAGVMALKLVNPAAAAVPVAVTIKGDAPIRSAALQWVRADALSEQNSLETPDNIQAEPGPLRRSGRVVEWTMPAWSVGVLRIEFSDPTN